MQKLLFIFPVVAMLAAGCTSSNQASIQTPVAQNVNAPAISTSTPVPTTNTLSIHGSTQQPTPTPKPSQQVAQNPTPTPTPTIATSQTFTTTPSQIPNFNIVTNSTLHFSVNVPQDDKLVDIDASPAEGQVVLDGDTIENQNNSTLSAPIGIQMLSSPTANLTAQDSYDLSQLIDNFNDSSAQQFTTTTGLTGIIYNNPNQPAQFDPNFPYLKEAVLIAYPSSLQQVVKPGYVPDLVFQYPFIEISMAGTATPFTDAQQQLLMQIVNSFQFTN